MEAPHSRAEGGDGAAVCKAGSGVATVFADEILPAVPGLGEGAHAAAVAANVSGDGGAVSEAS